MGNDPSASCRPCTATSRGTWPDMWYIFCHATSFRIVANASAGRSRSWIMRESPSPILSPGPLRSCDNFDRRDRRWWSRADGSDFCSGRRGRRTRTRTFLSTSCPCGCGFSYNDGRLWRFRARAIFEKPSISSSSSSHGDPRCSAGGSSGAPSAPTRKSKSSSTDSIPADFDLATRTGLGPPFCAMASVSCHSSSSHSSSVVIPLAPKISAIRRMAS